MVHKLGRRGDTIVEVLIAIAVLSSVLGITYSIVNQNMLTMQDNSERTTASKLAQTQIERLRDDYAEFTGSDLDDYVRTRILSGGALSRGFCFTGDPTDLYADGDRLTNLNDAYPAGFPGQCIMQGGLYYVSVEYNEIDDNFLIRVRWDSIRGGQSEIVMGYRVK